ncbi:hypothetical protein LCL85_00310 [Vibrio alginolyticus]|nr:hypothetical protein [Vibrio alginolyticus]
MRQSFYFFYEAKVFARIAFCGVMNDASIKRTLIISKLLTEIRKQTGVVA